MILIEVTVLSECGLRHKIENPFIKYNNSAHNLNGHLTNLCS